MSTYPDILSPKNESIDTYARFNEIEKNLILKMAINDENELNTLLAYYRQRINDFDKERKEWLERLESIRQSQAEKHKTDWELKKRKDEIAELQKTISESKLSLFDERQQILKLTRENDLLKIKEIEDRKKISELLALTDSVEEEITMYKDLRPESNVRFIKSDLNLNANKENTKNSQKFTKTTFNTKGKSVFKTIYLPNEQLNIVALENESLKNQLNAQAKMFNEEIQILKEELRIKDEENKMRFNLDQFTISEMQDKIHKTEKHLLDLTKDFFSLRIKSEDNERKLNEENELLRLRNAALANKLLIQSKNLEVETKISKELVEKKSEEYTNKFRNQIRQKDESLQLIKDQYSKIQQIYLERVKELEENLTKLAEKYYKLEKRRNLEVQGYKSDVKRLRDEISRLKSENIEKKEDFSINEIEEESKTKAVKIKKNVCKEPAKQELEDESVNLEELEDIKTQLDDLEKKLDQTRKK